MGSHIVVLANPSTTHNRWQMAHNQQRTTSTKHRTKTDKCLGLLYNFGKAFFVKL